MDHAIANRDFAALAAREALQQRAAVFGRDQIVAAMRGHHEAAYARAGRCARRFRERPLMRARNSRSIRCDSRRMRVVERGVERIGRQRGRIVFVQLDERVDEVLRIRLRGGERVGLELVFARSQAAKRRDEEYEHRQREEEQHERKTAIAADERRPHAQSFIEPDLLREPAEQREHREADRRT